MPTFACGKAWRKPSVVSFEKKLPDKAVQSCELKTEAFYIQRYQIYILIYIYAAVGSVLTRVYQHSKALRAVNQTHGVTSSVTRPLQGLGALPFPIAWCTPPKLQNIIHS